MPPKYKSIFLACNNLGPGRVIRNQLVFSKFEFERQEPRDILYVLHLAFSRPFLARKKICLAIARKPYFCDHD